SMNSPFHFNGIGSTLKEKPRTDPGNVVISRFAFPAHRAVSSGYVLDGVARGGFCRGILAQRLAEPAARLAPLSPMRPDDRRMGDIGRSAAGRELGMGRAISRRDFFDGVAVTAGAAAVGVPASVETAYAASSVTGVPAFLGNTSQALSVLHALRDERFWQYAGPPVATGEIYDLVVVGAGLSGV